MLTWNIMERNALSLLYWFFYWHSVTVLFCSKVLCIQTTSKSCRLFLPNIPAVCFPVSSSVKQSSSLPLRNIFFSPVLSIQNHLTEIIFRVTDCHTDHVVLCPHWHLFSGPWNINIALSFKSFFIQLYHTVCQGFTSSYNTSPVAHLLFCKHTFVWYLMLGLGFLGNITFWIHLSSQVVAYLKCLQKHQATSN